MTATNFEVIKAWGNDKPCDGANLTTDGVRLFSYALRIGDTAHDKKLVLAYTTGAGHFQSHTTSGHVRLALQHADSEPVEPVERAASGEYVHSRSRYTNPVNRKPTAPKILHGAPSS